MMVCDFYIHDCVTFEMHSYIADLRSYFSQFGEIESAIVMYHHDKRHSRGFGFVVFRNTAGVHSVMRSGPHVIRGKSVC